MTLFPLTLLANRGLIRLEDAETGAEAADFLQNLVTNDIGKAVPGQGVYAALLSPQGRFLHDFFMTMHQGSYYLECEADRRDDLIKRLSMYRLRRPIQITADESQSIIASPDQREAEMIYPDPRSPAMGLRAYIRKVPETGDNAFAPYDAYDVWRIRHALPDGSRDMIPDKAIILENNFIAANGVDFAKGCYIGQELISRAHHTGEVRKCLIPFYIKGAIPPFDADLLTPDGTAAARMRSHATAGGETVCLALTRPHKMADSPHLIWQNSVLTPLAVTPE